MSDPILEALTFALESDMTVDIDQTPVPNSGQQTGIVILPSRVVLGENSCTPCPFPNCSFISELLCEKEHKSNFLKHLLLEHKFVLDQVDNIANLHKYVLHWKERFSSNPVTDFCVAFNVGKSLKSEDVLAGNIKPENSDCNASHQEQYFMLPDVLPEDKDLRTKLWNQRLELILEVNRREREQTDFRRRCLFCKHICQKNRAELFTHMNTDHSFHIGQPDNLVFVNELFYVLNEKMNSLICIFCEKTFKDKTVMREHMRKKLHKRINPENPEYDRFYVINYLEPGKGWKALDNEDQEDDRVEQEWVEAKEEATSIVCLLCLFQSCDFDTLLNHMISEHKFNFSDTTLNCDFYQKVKIVNYIRRFAYQNQCPYCDMRFLDKPSYLEHFKKHGISNDEFPSSKSWDRPEHYFPTYENDQFLILLDKDNNTGEDDFLATSSDEEGVHVIPEDLSFALPAQRPDLCTINLNK